MYVFDQNSRRITICCCGCQIVLQAYTVFDKVDKLEMKRNISRKSETAKNTERVGGGFGDHFAWNLVVRKLDYRTQMMMSQQNKYMAEVVDINAKHELQKYRRRLQDDKYL